MANIKDLKQKELEQLNKETDLKELESLIIQGADARIPIVFDLTLYDKKNEQMRTETVKCYLKPLTSTEVQNSQRTAIKFKNTTLQIELLKKGMFDSNDEHFNQALIEALPSGTIDKLAEKLLEISGVEIDPNQSKEMMEKMMGF